MGLLQICVIGLRIDFNNPNRSKPLTTDQTRLLDEQMDIAEKVIISHHRAINEADTEAYFNTICFPFTFHRYDGLFYRVSCIESYKNEYPMPWEFIKNYEPDWPYTELEELEEVVKSETQLAYKLVARRINSEGKTGSIFQAIWVLGLNDNMWGVQTRYNLGIFSNSNGLAA